ncbi:FAS1-like dehydratase domain-containing protein [Mangrovicella endophytica]|uniref:FAS1-like dehydratase domain-containing protein n=1 Tax=Mangrovicella endophytica TaxID=2066697 RepID=UPI000C9DE118|nr:MaoC family dehydratase N-terminal domain-containing protein [Mangrovicella endophytica]
MPSYEEWKGKTLELEERCDAWPLRALQALLDRSSEVEEGAPILPLAHWVYFPPLAPQSRIGSDGHPQRGDFLPPLPQPRRMWAASDISFLAPMRIGQRLKKIARIDDIAEKSGKSGTLVFVTVSNRYEANGQGLLEERQTLVYRDDPAPGEAPPPPKPAPTNAAWSQEVEPDPVLLFRYSAATFNGHRIHYDAPYASSVEGYPAPVVHGQLTATLMLLACLDANPGLQPRRFSFRAVRPIFSGDRYFVEGAPAEESGTFKLWARDADGALAMTADLEATS